MVEISVLARSRTAGRPPIVAAGVSFVDYHYYEDLASGASYTPPVKTFGFMAGEKLYKSDVHFQFWDGGAWVDNHHGIGDWGYFHQDDDQSIRVHNSDAASAYKFGLTGRTWSGYTSYHHYEDLAGGATYLPTAQAFGLFLGEDIREAALHPEIWDGAAWIRDASGTSGVCRWTSFHQDNGQNMRWKNQSGGALKLSLTGAVW